MIYSNTGSLLSELLNKDQGWDLFLGVEQEEVI